ncbi:heme biosynthesis HemY N-terminal domain-containing protein [Pseudovibrio sp. Tun.PSC04-5.I4]|uniref:heme biosynthesis HemY N-terminal domain-containing protein n=1 Tax=Pseudovibrio sp. Tun.PSC04-5.I4 TaxID=1798213 RepID=UPI00088953E7|nr:heme biosynthesis HemY N-terminal domain-containing protein [Pseudovibrio sp. Tun.PSC04-5.I4]SDR31198.1 HemY protein [Pseudovibrio sp. Tun.PSC04-5.I4]
MVRVLIFFAFVFLLALGGAWMADRPGVLTLEWQGYVVQASLLTAVVAFGASLVASIVIWGFFRLLWKSPTLASRFMQRRRKDKGFDALSQGLMALGAGDTLHARKHGLKADKLLLGNEPAAKLLLAQTAQLSGDNAESRKRFEEMLEDGRSMAVGLHGLYIEAERESEPAAARHFAEEAFNLVPGLHWAGNAVLGYQAVSGDWEEAIATLERNYAAHMLDKKTLRRHKAVLLTARALELENENPDRARTLAVEAHGLAPSLVPAALVAARLRTRSGDVRKASKIIEAAWKLNPHPDLAEAYAHVRPGDSVSDRLSRAKSLASMRAYSSEGAISIAVAAIEAKQFDEAREQLKRVLRSEPSQRAFLLMADLEDREHGDQGRIREWLARAVRAPQDEVWIADGVISANWTPVSPRTGRVDACKWAAPEGVFGQDQTVEVIDDKLFEPPVLAGPVQVLNEPVEAVIVVPKAADSKPVVDTSKAEVEPTSAPATKPQVLEPKPVVKAAETPPPVAKPAGKPKPEEPATVVPVEASSWASPKTSRDGKPEVVDLAKAEKKTSAEDVAKLEKKDDALVEFPLSHLPDDPGPEPDEDDLNPPKDKSFRFFR